VIPKSRCVVGALLVSDEWTDGLAANIVLTAGDIINQELMCIVECCTRVIQSGLELGCYSLCRILSEAFFPFLVRFEGWPTDDSYHLFSICDL
jgi:hypothetical protein